MFSRYLSKSTGVLPLWRSAKVTVTAVAAISEAAVENVTEEVNQEPQKQSKYSTGKNSHDRERFRIFGQIR